MTKEEKIKKGTSIGYFSWIHTQNLFQDIPNKKQ